jgi:hypothetical protein
MGDTATPKVKLWPLLMPKPRQKILTVISCAARTEKKGE